VKTEVIMSAKGTHRAAELAQKPGTTYKERYTAGKRLRDSCSRESHAKWNAPKDRRDPVDMVLASEKGRLPGLLPLRHGRMVRSAFTFYRGSALTMAADLSSIPTTGIHVQCCGDAHLCNFGGFATPERKILFSVNDLDETLPAPWEWDVKRLAASFVIACRDRAISDSNARDIARTCVRTYRESMGEFSRLRTLELWYYALEPLQLPGMSDPNLRKRAMKRIEQEQAKSRGEEMFPKLADHSGGKPIIRDQLPAIFHHKDMPAGRVSPQFFKAIDDYRTTLSPAYQALLNHYEITDVAHKVVGIGSVGTACFVFLMMAGTDDPLFLQVKEARRSVLEPYAGASEFSNSGQRIVNGYRSMQPASDPFLGWTRRGDRHFFIRQLKDVKISIRVETFERSEMDLYAQWCGKALALSHARSGSPATLSGYMGKGDALDRAIAQFSISYADQNEKDHAALAKAVRKGKVKAVFEDEH
jgi:uncharacterized protein (DUF2252 family)